MWAGTREMVRHAAVRWLEVSGAAAAVWGLWCRMQVRMANASYERRVQEELEAYARLDVRAEDDLREMGTRVSRVIAEKSAFGRAAMLARDGDGRLAVVGSAGMDVGTIGLMDAWAGRVPDAGRSGLGVRVGGNGFAVILARMPVEMGYRRAIVVPMWTVSGRMMGALAVCADGLMDVRRSALTAAVAPLEALAVKVARSMESAAVAERLMRAERLAGVGLMASGMAHALSNPLTAVLGFAELIAGSTGEARVKEDAEIIVREAQRMRETVETMIESSRPVSDFSELVDVAELVRELAGACAERLENRGVRLVVEASEVPGVRGNRQRLRLMVEHLLNNAAQALASVRGLGEQVIRMAVSVAGGSEGQWVHLMVSDTGPGFMEPARVFDPMGVGLGLSVCYGIAHEHGGEIRAFAMHPHGAGVAVELPAARVSAEKNMGVVEEPVSSASD
jgi:signal transduction histidine kinase